MLHFLGNGDTWKELRSISRHRRCPLLVAVPFLGKGGGKLLHLKRGDVLVVALTMENSRNGSVCPAEIKRLRARGVKVFLSPVLHAKVLLCGHKAVVGSANLSQTSFAHLDEAALLTTDTNVVKHIRSWFQQRTVEEVSPKWLDICAKAYRPPHGGIRRGRNKAVRLIGKQLWLVGLSLEDYPEDEAATEEHGRQRAKRELSDPKGFRVETIRWTGEGAFVSSMRRGDTVIQVVPSEDARSHYVEEVARLIGIRRTKSRRGSDVTYIYLESRKRPKRTPWVKFKRNCFTSGLKLKSNIVTRRITSPAQAAKVLAVVSREPR